jgi:hypothetical protein
MRCELLSRKILWRLYLLIEISTTHLIKIRQPLLTVRLITAFFV